ncbi:DNA cytosine methyltransferase [Phenylobacterium sp.]|uniref:DNA cytosine methyltransferase n=1 Tax=Phenylobacterium sp. TaxID=1871053 RepID=UPI00198A019D|nr:DNA cytosine methyltransferase [Phenylobacterium sp.]MBC7167097.1 DNA cytosine methyltransferase [Phenylobacterium sp.]
MSRNRRPAFYEFFAGGGMARLGLGEGWDCLFANDFDPVKAAAYRANFADAAEHFREGDVWKLTAGDLPGQADLAWASSPCQDFSLAGARAGLAGGRSSAFFGFWKLMQALNAQGRAPRTIVLENVVGLLTSHGGADFEALCRALAEEGYSFGALEMDAAAFVPQSRPRVFVVAVREPPPPGLQGEGVFHSRSVRQAQARLPDDLARRWIWWRLPAPPARNTDLAALLEPDEAVAWRSSLQTQALLAQMSPLHRRRFEAEQASKGRAVGAAYRRIRVEDGVRVQRAEVRLDGLAGCLRTPAGGSSRQMLLVGDEAGLRSRLVSPREGARLMGLPEAYVLPASATQALHVVGDGVAVPVVRWLSENLLRPLLAAEGSALAAE